MSHRTTHIKKVLMVASSYPRYPGDSASIFLRHLARSVAANGVKVHVLVPRDPLQPESNPDQSISMHRFSYFPRSRDMLAYGSGILPNLRAHPWLVIQIPAFLLAMFFSLISVARKVRPDIIHAHWIIPVGFIAVIVGRLLDIPVVTTLHGGDAFALKGRGYRWMKRFALCHSSAWTANTQATAAEVDVSSTRCNPSHAIVPMGVDVPYFSSGKRERLRNSTSPETFIILFVGRLVEKKGVHLLIDAFASLVRNSSAKEVLWIVGDGNERRRLEQLAVNHHIEEMVRFFGTVENEELPDLYAAADLFVAPSIEDRSGDTEGQGVVLIEAMAAGVPIIASDVGGIGEVIVDGESGLLVKAGDSEALAGMLHRIIADVDMRTRMVRAAHDMVENRYDWEIIAYEFLQVYDDAAW